ncbi:MAG TPA: hypothetical protein VEW28_10610 [Candidatus Kapabacteria bacterium]|nr:hypothetical protein [Candidatus Kapabacteria bacterium]
MRPVEGSRIRMGTQDITTQDFFLLSVREHSLVVSPYETEYFHIDAVIEKAFTVPFEKVTTLEQIIPANLGFIATGTGAGIVSGFFVEDWIQNTSSAPTQFNPTQAVISIASGAILGTAVGYFFYHGQTTTFDVNRDEDRVKLHHVAIYHDEEPPELAKIK